MVKTITAHKSTRAETPAPDSSDAGDNESTINAASLPSASLSRMSCGSCRKKDSQSWWKAPRGLDFSAAVLCDACSMNWRKYADVKSSRPDDSIKAKGADKRESTPFNAPISKRIKVSPPCVGDTMLNRLWRCQVDSDGRIQPALKVQRTCVCCRKGGTEHSVLVCLGCNVTVHAGESNLSTLSVNCMT